MLYLECDLGPRLPRFTRPRVSWLLGSVRTHNANKLFLECEISRGLPRSKEKRQPSCSKGKMKILLLKVHKILGLQAVGLSPEKTTELYIELDETLLANVHNIRPWVSDFQAQLFTDKATKFYLECEMRPNFPRSIRPWVSSLLVSCSSVHLRQPSFTLSVR